jgi:hypothetical protein
MGARPQVSARTPRLGGAAAGHPLTKPDARNGRCSSFLTRMRSSTPSGGGPRGGPGGERASLPARGGCTGRTSVLVVRVVLGLVHGVACWVLVSRLLLLLRRRRLLLLRRRRRRLRLRVSAGVGRALLALWQRRRLARVRVRVGRSGGRAVAAVGAGRAVGLLLRVGVAAWRRRRRRCKAARVVGREASRVVAALLRVLRRRRRRVVCVLCVLRRGAVALRGVLLLVGGRRRRRRRLVAVARGCGVRGRLGRLGWARRGGGVARPGGSGGAGAAQLGARGSQQRWGGQGAAGGGRKRSRAHARPVQAPAPAG